MMADYIKREDAINAALEQLPVCLEMDAVESALMELPAADVVSRDCYNAILWENDVMRKQLAEIGKGFGQKMNDVAPVKHGAPIKFFNDPYTGRMFTTCSICDGKISPKDKWCRHCGAKMDKED